jgi:hypothetical protein
METFCFPVRNFADLQHQRGKYIQRNAELLGYHWRFLVWVRGNMRSSQTSVNVSTLIECTSTLASPIQVCYTVAINEVRKSSDIFGKTFVGNSQTNALNPLTHGFSDFIERDMILDPANGLLDEDGTLHVTFRLRRVPEGATWSPPHPIAGTSKSILANLMDNDKHKDISFIVDDGGEFAAHRCILDVAAPDLMLEISGASLTDDGAVIHLSNINAETFANVLSFCYTSHLATVCSCFDSAKLLLRAADRFGCIELKLFMETSITDNFLNETNAAECLMLAKNLQCARLTEAALWTVTLLPDEVYATDAWAAVQRDSELMGDLLLALIDPPVTPVAQLQKHLYEKGCRWTGPAKCWWTAWRRAHNNLSTLLAAKSSTTDSFRAFLAQSHCPGPMLPLSLSRAKISVP